MRSPKDIFLRPILATDTVQWGLRWERQKSALLEEKKDPWQRSVIIINFDEFFWEEKMKRRE